jgi:hypothetical protein
MGPSGRGIDMTSNDRPAGHELTEDELVSALVPDPSNLPDTTVMVGFLGRSSREGFWRLYLTADLGEFVDFAAADVLHTQVIESPADALGGRAVWIRRTATVHRSVTDPLGTQTEFLRGDVAAAFTAGAARARTLTAGRLPSLAGAPGLAADPTLFRANTCALSSCISNVAICTNPGQTTCDPAVCVAVPAVLT